MEQPRLIIKKEKNKPVVGTVVVEADVIKSLKEIKSNTGLSIQHIANTLLRYGIEHVKIEE